MGKGTADGVHTSQRPSSSAAHSAARGHTPGTPTRREAPLAGSQRHSDTHTHGHSRTETLKHGDTQQGRCSKTEGHTTDRPVHSGTKTVKHGHTFTAETFKQSRAHKPRHSDSSWDTHTKHAGTVQGGAGDCGRSRPLPPHAAAAGAQKFTTDRLAQTF